LRGPLRGFRYFLGAAAGEAGGVSVHFGLQEIEQTARLTKLLQPGNVFFDIGANVGFYSLLASRLVGATGTVIAFEPLTRNIAFLNRHLALNRCHNVRVMPFACAERSSIQIFCEGENNALGHLAGSDRDEELATLHRKSIVATVTLDEAVRLLGVTPQVIKIDVEGAELRVLWGASEIFATAHPVVLLSIHSNELRSRCLELLKARNYAIEPLDASTIEAAAEFVATPLGLCEP
jgi:FkbM family methyltransferase